MIDIRTGCIWLSLLASLGTQAWAGPPQITPPAAESLQEIQALYDQAIDHMVAQDMDEAISALEAILALDPGAEWEEKVQARLTDIERFHLWTAGADLPDPGATPGASGEHDGLKLGPTLPGKGRLELSVMGGFTGLHGFLGEEGPPLSLLALPYAGLYNAPIRGTLWIGENIAAQVALGNRNEGRSSGLGTFESWGAQGYLSVGIQMAPNTMALTVTPFAGLSLGTLYYRKDSSFEHASFVSLETGVRVPLSEHISLRGQAALKPMLGETDTGLIMSEVGIGLSLFL